MVVVGGGGVEWHFSVPPKLWYFRLTLGISKWPKLINTILILAILAQYIHWSISPLIMWRSYPWWNFVHVTLSFSFIFVQLCLSLSWTFKKDYTPLTHQYDHKLSNAKELTSNFLFPPSSPSPSYQSHLTLPRIFTF